MCEHPQHPRADSPLSSEQRSSHVNHSETTINTFQVFLMLVCVHQRTGFTQPPTGRGSWRHKTSQDGTEACWAFWWRLEGSRKGVFPISLPPLAFCPSFYFTLIYRNQNSSSPVQAIEPGKVTLETCPFSIECLQVTDHLPHTWEKWVLHPRRTGRALGVSPPPVY